MADRELSKEDAARVLGPVPSDKAFYFYSDVGRPVGKSSKSLVEFSQVLVEVDPSVVRFHLERGDFERWLKMLGDPVLADRFAALRGSSKPPAELRGEVSSDVKSRVDRLQKIASSSPSQGPREQTARTSRPSSSGRRRT